MKDKGYDAAILLGGGLAPDGSLDDAQKLQVQMAADLFAAQKITHIIHCGAYSYKDSARPSVSEARAYAAYAEYLGVPAAAMTLEESSVETLGNLYFAKKIILGKGWISMVIIPSANHATERATYLAEKIFGTGHNWTIMRHQENLATKNIERELRSLRSTKEINGHIPAGDHEAVYARLCETHPAYGGTRFTLEELKALLDPR